MEATTLASPQVVHKVPNAVLSSIAKLHATLERYYISLHIDFPQDLIYITFSCIYSKILMILF